MTHPSTQTSEDTWPPEEYRRIESRWKSDVDIKLDRLVTFADKYETLLDALFKRELRWARFQDAVIEKTLTGLIWSGIIFLGLASWHYFKSFFSGKN